MRPRLPATPLRADWELLQALLAFAFTVQQENALLKRELARVATAPETQSVETEDKNPLHYRLQRITASALNLTGASGAALALGGPSTMSCVARAGELAPDLGAKVDGHAGLSGECVRTADSVLCVNVEADPRVDILACRALGIRSIIYVPIRSDASVIGVLGVFSSRSAQFSPRDVRCLRFTERLVLEALEHGNSEIAEAPPLLTELLEVAPVEEAPSNVIDLSPEDRDWVETDEAAIEEVFRSAVAEEIAAEPAAEIAEEPQAEAAGDSTAESWSEDAEVEAEPQFESEIEPELAAAEVEDANSEVDPWQVSPRPSPEPAIEFPPDFDEERECSARLVASGETNASASQELPLELNWAALSEDRDASGRNWPAIGAGAAAVAVLLGGLAWSGLHMRSKLAAPSTSTPVTQSETAPEQPAPPKITESSKPGVGKSLMNGVQYWSSADYSRLTISLTHTVQIDSARLGNPDRIYFDLHGIQLTDSYGKTFDINDPLIKRVRIAQYQNDSTRLVFDVNGQLRFSGTTLTNPDRLIIEFFGPNAGMLTPKNELAPENTREPLDARIPPEPKIPSLSGRTITVVIDPGHGGTDTGTVGRSGMQEKELALDVARRLGALLKQEIGAKVIFTREDDRFVALNARSAMANDSHADFFLSIHANYSSYPTVRGVETYYFRSSTEAIATAGAAGPATTVPASAGESSDAAHAFAADVESALAAGLSGPKDAMRDRGVKSAPLMVLRGTQMPAVLAEISFLSSDRDDRKLQSAQYREQIATALFHGIAKYMQRANTTAPTQNVASLTGHKAGQP